VIFAELVDCDTLDSGCKGGLPENAYKAIESLGGLETEKDYPYEGDDEKCHFNKSDVIVTVQGALNITKNETQMAQWLYKNGPISIGINANAMQVIISVVVSYNILFGAFLWFVCSGALKCGFLKTEQIF
jgi:cathepsin F